MKYQALRGTKDILPEEIPVWQYVERTINEIFQNFGFDEIRTPVFEQTELFTRSIGNSTDIVSKEMYTFSDKKGRSLTLRPEATAGVVRSAIENDLLTTGKEVRLYYIGPMFRYERPQAGRFRQFQQAGVEIFGSASALSDADVILSGVALFKKLGLRSLEINLNSVGCKTCRPSYEKKLKGYLKNNLNSLCEDCKNRFNENILRVLDCKVEGCREVISKAPSIRGSLCTSCATHLDTVADFIKEQGIDISFNEKLVRGLDYYTSTVFEIISKDLGSQNALCGGGRYDNLVHELGGKETPAVGMALGVERVIAVMQAQKIKIPEQNGLFIFIASVGKEAEKMALNLANILRDKGLRAETDVTGSSLKSQFKTADRKKARFVLVIGNDEISKNVYKLRNMQNGEEKEISLDEIKGLA